MASNKRSHVNPELKAMLNSIDIMIQNNPQVVQKPRTTAPKHNETNNATLASDHPTAD